MCVRGAIALVCAVLGLASVRAGHEINYYPSFYPQEIRIEPLDPERRRGLRVSLPSTSGPSSRYARS